MKITYTITRTVDLTQEQLDLLKKVREQGGLYNTLGERGEMLEQLLSKGLIFEESSNLVVINERGRAVLKSIQ